MKSSIECTLNTLLASVLSLNLMLVDGCGNSKSTVKETRIVIGVDQRGGVSIAGRAVDRAKFKAAFENAWALAKVDSRNLDSTKKQATGGIILVLWVDDDVNYEYLYKMMLECQTSAEYRMTFAPRSRFPAPPVDSREPKNMAVPRPGKNELDEVTRMLPVQITVDKEGLRLRIGENERITLNQFKAELTQIKNDPDLPFDRVILGVDRNLRFADLTDVVDAASEAGFSAIGFPSPRE